MFSVSSRQTYAAVWLRKQLVDPNWSSSIGAAAFVVFVASTFLVRGHAVPVAMIVVMTLVALSSGVAQGAFRRNAWLWLFGIFFSAWTLLGTVAGGPGYNISDFFNLVLLGAFFLSLSQVSRALSTRQILCIIAVAGGISALASIVLHFVSSGDLFDRLSPLGRGRNPIPGAGGLAVALIAFAALWLERAPGRRIEALHVALAFMLLVALAWTQSRAPILSLCLALPLAWWLEKRGGTTAVLVACGGVWLFITGLGLLEPVIKAMVCKGDANWCRPALRTEIWGWVRDQILLHPALGTGPSFRFQKVWMSHPHNGIFGIAMYYGLPALVAFGAMIGFYARELTRLGDRSLRYFGLASIVFSFGYMGTDLSNPFAFFNMHYLFLWLPCLLVLASKEAGARGEEKAALGGSDELRRI
ncbi:O-antigen ligase family protein [Microvirga pakistanensis]|uniref:O-antigen ligase family protein n=1 Tax=Microvirga pakistanensis TaxID=1682650 RepID=UPI00141AABFD|nr:O-antigen ligase family protein [Microvirga pakistanensis]